MSLIGWETLLNKVLLVMRLFFSHKLFIFFFFVWVINCLLNSKFLNCPKPKSFADNMFVLGRKENVVEKGMRLFFSHNVFKSLAERKTVVFTIFHEKWFFLHVSFRQQLMHVLQKSEV